MNITLIGAGNLATRLGICLKSNNHNIVQVYSRTEESAKKLGDILETDFTNNAAEINTISVIYIVSVSDSAIETVLSSIDFRDKLIVHTAGSVPMAVLSGYSKNFGVFYPLQTFSKEREVDFSKIPICVEANSSENLKILISLGDSISNDVRQIDSEQRKQIHLSAVFVCNFVNHFFTIGAELLKEKCVDYEILKPLIQETAQKATEFSPKTVQTGPAVRFDKNIIEKQLKMLEGHPEWQELYKLVSESIHRLYK
jgi:predicted short-subunit dehydrogenase-like oxidoreductase (DUF2520 family)